MYKSELLIRFPAYGFFKFPIYYKRLQAISKVIKAQNTKSMILLPSLSHRGEGGGGGGAEGKSDPL